MEAGFRTTRLGGYATIVISWINLNYCVTFFSNLYFNIMLFPPEICSGKPAGLRCGILLACAMLLCLLTGCGLMNKDSDIGAQAADAKAGETSTWTSDPVPYTVSIKVSGGPDFLKGKMEDLSQLIHLQKEPPDSMLALERRCRQDQATAEKLLQSQCYYDGKAEINIDENAKPVKVLLTLKPGPQFTVGRADVVYDPPPKIPEAFKDRERATGFWGLEKEKLPPPEFPVSVPGVEIGKPIVADAMLAAVEAMPQNLRKTGYPLARVSDSVYTLNKPDHKLNADIKIDPGPPALMGRVIIKGNKDVNASYLRKLMPWKPGTEPWDDALLQDYANTLRALGLFRSVEARPATTDLEHDSAGEREGAAILPVEIELEEGPPRTVGASLRYDSDTGFGVEGTWEHRNLFHNGEKLSVDVPISQQESGIKAHFEKPAFFDRDQRLFANASALWENTDAYQQETLKGEMGLDRRLARQWRGQVALAIEGGYLKDNEHSRKEYEVISPRANLHYDGRDNKLNPTNGAELELKVEPFSGYYGEETFGAFAGRVSAAAYYAPLGKKKDGAYNDKLVLAGRVEGGAMPASSSLHSIPSSLRYYTGGAGSVRGYPYQSIGPRDSDGDPLGGRSYQVVNLEARYMVAKDIGIVPFLDGGMVYKDQYPRVIGDMDWGLGIGFRYYTPIGPVRLDVATPLNPNDDDPPVQFYISIGQSF